MYNNARHLGFVGCRCCTHIHRMNTVSDSPIVHQYTDKVEPPARCAEVKPSEHRDRRHLEQVLLVCLIGEWDSDWVESNVSYGVENRLSSTNTQPVLLDKCLAIYCGPINLRAAYFSGIKILHASTLLQSLNAVCSLYHIARTRWLKARHHTLHYLIWHRVR